MIGLPCVRTLRLRVARAPGRAWRIAEDAAHALAAAGVEVEDELASGARSREESAMELEQLKETIRNAGEDAGEGA